MFFDKPYALVLSGGGAKGSYQMGAWKAFRELGIKFNAVIGTSVGALNGAAILQGDLKLGVDLWENMSLEKIIDIPQELMKEGKFLVTKENVAYLKQVRDNIIKHGGMDTAPLKKIIDAHLKEDKIRRSGIDFGMMAYEITGWKPHEIFLNDIPQGMLNDYLMASSSFPGFKAVKVKDKQFIDGGFYDNIPFGLAKRRGYRRIIIVDVSGFGINRKPEVQGTETVYIKNSIDMGNIFDFTQDFIQSYMKLGYLDTMKVFGRNSGIKYFYNFDENKIAKLEKILVSEAAFNEYRRFIEPENYRKNRDAALTRVRQLLPDDLKGHHSLAMSLVEYGALVKRVERNTMYRYSDLLKTVWHQLLDLNNYEENTPDRNVSFLEKISGRSRENAIIPLRVLYTLLKIYFRKR